MLRLRESLPSEFGVFVVLLLFLCCWLFWVSRHLRGFFFGHDRQCAWGWFVVKVAVGFVVVCC